MRTAAGGAAQGQQATALVKVSVVSDSRRLDVGIPAALALVEVLPGFARSLGVLDPSLAHAGYALKRADGSTLDANLSAAAQGVRDGDVLTLTRGNLVTEPKVYDDVTEAVIDAIAAQHGAWTPRDNARTALAVSLTFLTLCAVLLGAGGRGTLAAPLIAAGGALLLLIAAAVVGRVGTAESGTGLALAASGYAALAAFLSIGDGSMWAWPLAAAGGAAAITGGIAMLAVPKQRQLQLIPVAWGAAIAIPALIAAVTEQTRTPYVLGIAIIGSVANLLPWLAMTSTRIKALSPQSDQEIFAAPDAIDAAAIAKRATEGATVLNALRLALGGAALVATPMVASDSTAGAALCALVYLGMMFQSRQIYARAGVLVVMAIGAIGLTATGVTIIVGRPDLHTELTVLLGIAVAVIIGLTLLGQRVRLGLGRLADAGELLVLAAVLPIGVIAAGWM